LGENANKNDFKNIFIEKKDVLFLHTCIHDETHGCDISFYDASIAKAGKSTLLYGNLQSENYFVHYKEEITKWLKIKPEYESLDFCQEDLCVINMRGGEYFGLKELFLDRKYWLHGMKNMRNINPSMRFVIITDDVNTAKKVLPGVEAYHFDLAKDYIAIKNAYYLLLSNSSFAFFPAFTNTFVKFIIAPKYWARHNVSDGYWATSQNIYTGWNYQDRNGKLYTSAECNSEYIEYIRKTDLYNKVNLPIGHKNRNLHWNSIKSYFKKTLFQHSAII
jgi:hypothetical protein